MGKDFECVTSMSRSYYESTGHNMLLSFIENWPSSINLRIYHEDNLDENIQNLPIEYSDRYQLVDLRENEPNLIKFVNRHKNRADQQNPLELHLGAVRFSYKTFSIFNAAEHSDADYLIWIDADTFTHSKVTHSFLRTLTDPLKYLTYLGRDNNYSECGFVIYNLKHPAHSAFFDTWRHLYESDELFKLHQWHDSFVFDRIRDVFEKDNKVENINLSQWGKDYDHVFINSILGEYMDHMKGPRKNHGKSPRSDLFTHKESPYWD